VHAVSIRGYNSTFFDASLPEPLLLTISGRNFGPARFGRTSLLVQLEVPGDPTARPQPCYDPSFQGDATVVCFYRPSSLVETRVVTVTMLRERSSGADNPAGLVHAVCIQGKYGRAGEVCRLCPPGGDCPGGDSPLSLPGFWRQSRELFLAYVWLSCVWGCVCACAGVCVGVLVPGGGEWEWVRACGRVCVGVWVYGGVGVWDGVPRLRARRSRWAALHGVCVRGIGCDCAGQGHCSCCRVRVACSHRCPARCSA
jgi:hypothetical protein